MLEANYWVRFSLLARPTCKSSISLYLTQVNTYYVKWILPAWHGSSCTCLDVSDPKFHWLLEKWANNLSYLIDSRGVNSFRNLGGQVVMRRTNPAPVAPSNLPKSGWAICPPATYAPRIHLVSFSHSRAPKHNEKIILTIDSTAWQYRLLSCIFYWLKRYGEGWNFHRHLQVCWNAGTKLNGPDFNLTIRIVVSLNFK